MQSFTKPNREAYTNFLRAKYDAYTGATSVRSYPYYLLIDPADVCNLRCTTCPTGMDNQARRKGELTVLNRSQRTVMTPELFDAVIEELGPYLFFVMFYNWGEPLLNKHIHQFIAKAKTYGIETEMHTNLSLRLTDQRIEELLDSGLDNLVCSIDGFTQQVYEIHRVGGNIELIKKNLETLAKTRDRLGAKTQIVYKMLIFAHNEHEISMAQHYCNSIGVGFTCEHAAVPDESWMSQERRENLPANFNRKEVSDSKSAQWLVHALGKSILFAQQLASAIRLRSWTRAALATEQQRLNVLYPDKKGLSEFPKFCSWHYAYSVITAGGPVAPCCSTGKAMDDFGQVTKGKTSFADVWNNNKYRRVRGATDGMGAATERTICEPCRFPRFVQHLYSMHDARILAAAHLKFNNQDPLLAKAFGLLSQSRYGDQARTLLQLGIFDEAMLATGIGDEREMSSFVQYYAQHLLGEPTALNASSGGFSRKPIAN